MDACRFHLKIRARFLDTLVAEGLLTLNREAEYPLLSLSQAGREALSEEGEILANPLKTALQKTSRHAAGTSNTYRAGATGEASDTPADAQMDADEDDRFEKLRAWRRIEAERQSVPPFVIFHDSTLRAIAQVNPTDLEGMRHVPGIGPRKLESYGEAVITLLREME